MATCFTIDELIPRRGQMSLLDQIEDYDHDWAETSALVAQDNLFFEPQHGLPTWVGIELMAQTVAVYAGIKARQTNKAPRLGFFLSVRDFRCEASHFLPGTKLIIRATNEWSDEQKGVFVGAFDCHIRSDICLAEARLTAFQGSDLKNFLQSSSPASDIPLA